MIIKRIGKYQEAILLSQLMNSAAGKNRKKIEITEADIPNQNAGTTNPSRTYIQLFVSQPAEKIKYDDKDTSVLNTNADSTLFFTWSIFT